jgi:hypothetical protein
MPQRRWVHPEKSPTLIRHRERRDGLGLRLVTYQERPDRDRIRTIGRPMLAG